MNFHTYHKHPIYWKDLGHFPYHSAHPNRGAACWEWQTWSTQYHFNRFYTLWNRGQRYRNTKVGLGDGSYINISDQCATNFTYFVDRIYRLLAKCPATENKAKMFWLAVSCTEAINHFVTICTMECCFVLLGKLWSIYQTLKKLKPETCKHSHLCGTWFWLISLLH